MRFSQYKIFLGLRSLPFVIFVVVAIFFLAYDVFNVPRIFNEIGMMLYIREYWGFLVPLLCVAA
jgi:hypothetical protein